METITVFYLREVYTVIQECSVSCKVVLVRDGRVKIVHEGQSYMNPTDLCPLEDLVQVSPNNNIIKLIT